MVPKICDFGLSRWFNEQKDRVINTSKVQGTMGYVAPERYDGVITFKSDIYSLGVIFAELLTGQKGHSPVENVVESWRERLGMSSPNTLLEQVKLCAEICIDCTDRERKNRPSMDRIIQKLTETETNVAQVEEITVLSDPEDSTVPSHITTRDTPRDGLPSMSEEEPSPRVLHMITGPRAPYIPGLFLAIMKIDAVLADKTTKIVVAKLSAKGSSRLRGLEVNIQKVRDQLAVLMTKTAMSNLTNEVNGWIRELRKLIIRVEDLMDKYLYYCFRMENEFFLIKYFTEAQYIIVFSEIADEVAAIQNKTKQVVKLKHQCLQLPRHDPEMETQRSQVSISEFVKDEDLVGIEDNRRMLTEWLYSDEPDSKVITVSGMGGLGKTALVANVYEREKRKFPARVWVAVSQTYTMDALLRKLLWEIDDVKHLQTHINGMDVSDLKEEIKEILKHRKCLIVLDDVWDQDVYFKLCYSFGNVEASRIIITTRKTDVATLAPPTRRLELQPLSSKYAFDLFCRKAFYNIKDHECPKELLHAATSIVDRCYGLPVAIVSIGSLLSLQPQIHHIWNQMYDQLETELSNSDNVREIFNLSYHDLSADLKNCFLYCSLFPKDYLISSESVVKMWIAEGFVLSRGNKTAEEVAERNLTELINCNLLVIGHNDEQGRVRTCRMHPIMRDLVLVAKQERFGSANDYRRMIQMNKDVRRLSSYGWKDNTPIKVNFPQLRTLVSLGTVSSSPGMLSSILSEATYLTVLELQDSEVTELPASIGILFNLRYIGLRRTKVKLLPDSVVNLSNLLTLDIKGTKIQRLPRGLGKVKKLRHLMADRCADGNLAVFPNIFGAQVPKDLFNLSEFPYRFGVEAPKDLSSLQELQTLETVEASRGLAEQLKKLMQLRSVWIHSISAADCANILATISNMPVLSSLLLSARDENEVLCFEALQPISRKLQKLIIIGQWAKGTLECPIFRVHGACLKYLDISWCRVGEDPLVMLAPYLYNLTYLSFNHIYSAKTLVLSPGSFPQLKMLVLKHMPDVNELMIADGALPCIEALYIGSLARLDKVPQGMESLRSLKRLWLLNLHRNFRSQWHNNRMFEKMQHVLKIDI
ncbi:disease resistance protein RPM1-like isoform X3 [Panicum virgatum]|nr:disease resistance protein RPM1-like isoform X3 [Panicum virgatum]XP_039822428.1 disease resistance protein RPM1-like isoform X3 [Panicum virgatum]